MPQLPKIVFDYAYLSQLGADSGGDPELYVLGEPAQQVLSQLAEMVLWHKTRWVNGTETEIENLAAEIYEELKVPLHFNDLIPFVDDIETLLRALQVQGQCCPDNVTYGPAESIPDSGNDPNDGPFPATWGPGETVVDLADYKAIWCGQAYHYVDWLIGLGDQMDLALNAGALNVEALAGILTFGAGIGLLVSIPFGLVAAVAAGIVAAGISVVWGASSSAIEAERDNIVCVILQNDETALRAKIESTVGVIAWNLFYQFLDYASLLGAIQTGTYKGETIPVRRSACPDCGLPEENPVAGPFIAVAVPDANLVLTPFTVGGATCTTTRTVEAGNVKALRFEGVGRNNVLNTFGNTIRFDPFWCTNIIGWSWRVRVLQLPVDATGAEHSLQVSQYYPNNADIILDAQYARNVWTVGTPDEHNQMLASYQIVGLAAVNMSTNQNWHFNANGASQVSGNWVIEVDNFYAIVKASDSTCPERQV